MSSFTFQFVPEKNLSAGSDGASELIRVVAREANAAPSDSQHAARSLCEQLESGHILYCEQTPFLLPHEDREFLLQQRQSSGKFHKNIAYRPLSDRLTGLEKDAPPADRQRLQAILRDYSARVTQFLDQLLPAYAASRRLDFASFRPTEEKGRDLRQRARNDLLHTDAFPTRPTNGDRILRVFTNLNPSESRVWLTGPTFPALARSFARTLGLPGRGDSASEQLRARMARVFVGRARSPYDRFMLRFHHFLKANHEFQETCSKSRWEFPPGSTWIVFTDMASHAAISGRFALEQTFIVPRAAMVAPQKSPAGVLETICGYPVTVP